jgi:superfamily II DNA or RNA helicase
MQSRSSAANFTEGAARMASMLHFDIMKCVEKVEKRKGRGRIVRTEDVLDEEEGRKQGKRGRGGEEDAMLPLLKRKKEGSYGEREYQKEAISVCRGRSGFLVSPCASGKTVMGCGILFQNGGKGMILTTRFADQWKETLDSLFLPGLKGCSVKLYRSPKEVDIFDTGDVAICTYGVLFGDSVQAKALRQVRRTTLILDEAHAAASPCILSSLKKMKFENVVALTATKVREDEEIFKLEEVVGGTIHEVDRSKLVRGGYVNDVGCVNVLLPKMEGRLLSSLSSCPVVRTIHPSKMKCLAHSLLRLQEMGHKTLVFCDDLFCLSYSFSKMKEMTPSLSCLGPVSMLTQKEERTSIFSDFGKEGRDPCCVFVSRTGDEALDVPYASAAVILWNQWGSRRQIVQRMGRLARPFGLDPVFLVLVSDDEREFLAVEKRNAYLLENGYFVQDVRLGKGKEGALSSSSPLSSALFSGVDLSCLPGEEDSFCSLVSLEKKKRKKKKAKPKSRRKAHGGTSKHSLFLSRSRAGKIRTKQGGVGGLLS